MGSHDSRQSFEKTACCGKVSHRVANTVIYLDGRTGLILPRGPASIPATYFCRQVHALTLPNFNSLEKNFPSPKNGL